MEQGHVELDGDAASRIAGIEAAGVPPWHALSVDSARRLEDAVFSAGSGPEMATVRDVAIAGPGGDVPIRLYRPPVEPLGTFVFLHGGGWTLGTLDSSDDICRHLAHRGECLVVSVDYRLAPEHPFPAALEDAWGALHWADRYGDTLGVATDRLAVGGTSAGGNLAAASARRAVDADLDLAGQYLLYPITDHAFDTASYRTFADGPLLRADDMRWFWSQYLRSTVDGEHPYASVLRAPEVADVAPATVVTAGHDVLRDEGVAYAARLADAGVAVTHLHEPALPHGFLSLTADVPRAEEAMARLAEAIREGLA